MRWSDDPKIREGLTPMESVVLKARKKKEPVISGPMTQCEIGQMLVVGLDVILGQTMSKQRRQNI